MNYFDSQIASERYNRGRPDYHLNTILKVKEYLQLNGKLEKALDVACGTGLSTKALLEIAQRIWGTDISGEMLSRAFKEERIQYIIASAEKQPFANEEFDLITVASGVHWFDIDRFLGEAHRLLKSKGWLILYENYFTGEMEGSEALKDWVRDVYLKKYPSPPRNNNYEWTTQNLLLKNFHFAEEQRFKNQVVFDKGQLMLYFTTQSNIINAVTSGSTTYTEAEDWIGNQLKSIFRTNEARQAIYFGNWIKFMQRL